MAPLVTASGKAIIAKRMFASSGQTEPNFIQWGTGTTTEALTDTSLTTPSNEARAAGTSSAVTITNTNDTHQVVGTLTSASVQTISEVGLFDAAGTGTPATGGNMYVHGNHVATALSTNDQITYTIQIQFS